MRQQKFPELKLKYQKQSRFLRDPVTLCSGEGVCSCSAVLSADMS